MVFIAQLICWPVTTFTAPKTTMKPLVFPNSTNTSLFFVLLGDVPPGCPPCPGPGLVVILGCISVQSVKVSAGRSKADSRCHIHSTGWGRLWGVPVSRFTWQSAFVFFYLLIVFGWLFLHVTCTSNDIIVQLWLCFNDSSGCALV